MTLRDIQHHAWHTAERQGFHSQMQNIDPRHATLVRLALIQTEATEALDELLDPVYLALQILLLHRTMSRATQDVKRHGIAPDVQDRLGMELADIVIRVCDLAEDIGIDVQSYVEQKQAINDTRPAFFGTPQEGQARE